MISHASPHMQTACDACQSCAQTCLAELYRHCLESGGAHAEAAHVRLMSDCAEICRTAADFMARGSAFHHQVCGTCAAICQSCAESCRRLGGMDACIAACERCAVSCRRMHGQDEAQA